MKARFAFLVLVFLYVLIIFPFAAEMRHRPLEVKLGYLPDAQILKVVSGDHQLLVAQYAVAKVLFYFGTLLQHAEGKTPRAEYFNMFKTMEKAVKLDPYNMDAYYFSQAAFTWELNRAKDVNALLDYGMKYRTWDWYLPFYAGFNSAYFLKDFSAAAKYMKKAAELSGNPLFTTLAARYFHSARETDLAILFLDNMIKTAKNDSVKKTYQMRKEELEAIRTVSRAVKDYWQSNGRKPNDLSELLKQGHLTQVPRDPYGGRFILLPDGNIEAIGRPISKE